MKYSCKSGFPVLALLLASTVLIACGDSSSTGPEKPTYNDISGSYSGVLVGSSQGINLDATFSLTINQDGGSISGSWALSGTLDDGQSTAQIQGSGPLSGTIESGDNPSVNLTVQSGSPCPGHSVQFSGAYDTSNSRLTISGPVEILNSSCEVVLTYQSTIILTR